MRTSAFSLKLASFSSTWAILALISVNFGCSTAFYSIYDVMDAPFVVAGPTSNRNSGNAFWTSLKQGVPGPLLLVLPSSASTRPALVHRPKRPTETFLLTSRPWSNNLGSPLGLSWAQKLQAISKIAKTTANRQRAARRRQFYGRSLLSQQTYCNYDRNHTGCMYTTANQNGLCGEVKKRGLTPEEIQIILKAHNDVRRTVARGEMPGQPPASNMRELTWDEEAASLAQLWADQCNFTHDLYRHTLKDGKEGPVHNGQNMWEKSGAWSLETDFTGPIVDAWVGTEVIVFDPEGVKGNGPRQDKTGGTTATGHYTQVVWAGTRRVGCGYIHHGTRKMLVCNYPYGGNGPWAPVYEIGKACSACKWPAPFCRDSLCIPPKFFQTHNPKIAPPRMTIEEFKVKQAVQPVLKVHLLKNSLPRVAIEEHGKIQQ